MIIHPKLSMLLSGFRFRKLRLFVKNDRYVHPTERTILERKMGGDPCDNDNGSKKAL